MSAPGHDELEPFDNWTPEQIAAECVRLRQIRDNTDAIIAKMSRLLGTPIAASGAGAATEAMQAVLNQAAHVELGLETGMDTRNATRELLRLIAALRPEEAAGQGEAFTQMQYRYRNGEGGQFTAWRDGYGEIFSDMPGFETRVAPATPRPAPVAPDIVPVAWRWDWIDSREHDGWCYTERCPTNDKKVVEPLYSAEALASLSSELAEAKRQRDEFLSKWTWNTAERRVKELTAEVVRLKAREKELLEAQGRLLDNCSWSAGEIVITERDHAALRALQPAEKDSTDEA